jgi:hypothetical protein
LRAVAALAETFSDDGFLLMAGSACVHSTDSLARYRRAVKHLVNGSTY